MVPWIAFVGGHNSGKTTVVSGLIRELSQRGFKIAAIKHARSPLVIEGHRDSEQLFAAGARIGYTASPGLALRYQREERAKTLPEIYAEVAPGMDLVMVEGFKQEPGPKIEVLRQEINSSLLEVEGLIARVADFAPGDDLPRFDHGDFTGLADFILHYFHLRQRNE